MSKTPSNSEHLPDNVISLEAARRWYPRHRRKPWSRAMRAADSRSYPCLYIFPVWKIPRDSVGG
ncbi:MAG: hypothetical protein JWM91_4190 [Rhodospirillales bacterium]|nr:hypothetical protein [Rhodospirillales bacterium]